jgi:hypothetical protein
MEGSVRAANDVDWFVYRAPKSETATVEFVKGGEPFIFPTTVVTVFDGLEQIGGETLQTTSDPLVLPRIVSPGTRLYVKVTNSCSAGCSLGPYELVVRTGPPG